MPNAAPNATPNAYATLVTPAARTRRGLFVTHRVGDRLYFEIPRRELGRDLLLVGRYARAAAAQGPPSPLGGTYGGDAFAERTLRWERAGNRVLLRQPSFSVTADTGTAVYRAVEAASYAPIIASLPVAAFGPDSAPVVDVTRLYTTGVREFAALGTVDESRSYVEGVTAFPDNVEVEATQTGAPSGGAAGAAAAPGGASPPASVSVLAHWSMVRLPAVPMRPRRADERVGYFSFDQVDVGAEAQRAVTRSSIVRWRLEKRDPTAAVSDPVRPIVYYVDPATPDVWKPWVRRAILSWRPAFEAAGFSNAIVAADPPSPTQDPDWSPDDVRHTVVRWLPSVAENARGPHVRDPRTGEILNGSIQVYQNVLAIMRDLYVVQAGPLDARARRPQLPDSLLGRLLEYAVAHEIGHTLGLRHDMLGSSLYPVDSLRSPGWVRRMGHSPSIMDYARFNYVAQPGDGVDVADLVPRVGPYDRFAIRWGYAPVPGAATPEAERLTLDRWALAQDTVPWLRFAEDNPAGGYGTANEAVGDADPVRATAFGVENLRRVVAFLPAVAVRPGEDQAALRTLYGRAVAQWATEMGHVAAVVGGATVRLKSGTQPGPVYAPLPRARQAAALAFLHARAFRTPWWLVRDTLVLRLQPYALTAVGAAQRALLDQLLDNMRLQRLVDYEALPSTRADSYALADYVRDLRAGLWAELGERRVAVDSYRRALQSAYLAAVAAKLTTTAGGRAVPNAATPPDARAALRADLAALRPQAAAAAGRAADAATRQHLEAAAAEVARVLRE